MFTMLFLWVPSMVALRDIADDRVQYFGIVCGRITCLLWYSKPGACVNGMAFQ